MKATDRFLNARAQNVRDRFEVPVLVAALLVVPVIFIEERATSSALLSLASWTNWLIWAVFAAEFLVVLALADRRGLYVRKAWLDLVIVVVSFPLLPASLESTRLLRLLRASRALRMLRLVRLAAILNRGGKATQAIFRTRGLGYMATLTLLVTLGIGGAFALLEDTPITDGLWWAIVTVTTVGYGDMFPVTPAGRIAAAALMILGIGFVAYVTAAVAAHFVEGDSSSPILEELEKLNLRLERIEQRLAEAEEKAVVARSDGSG